MNVDVEATFSPTDSDGQPSCSAPVENINGVTTYSPPTVDDVRELRAWLQGDYLAAVPPSVPAQLLDDLEWALGRIADLEALTDGAGA